MVVDRIENLNLKDILGEKVGKAYFRRETWQTDYRGVLYNKEFEVGTMAPSCNPSYSGGGDWDDLSSRPATQKSSQDPSQQKAGCCGVHLSLQQ
jgi:hypothetical protein